VIARVAPRCEELILNANGDPARFASFGLPVVADTVKNFPGPLAGILAALDWVAASRPDVEFVLSAAADCPFLPRDLVARLHRARAEQNAQLAVAASAGQSHPVIALWSVALREELRHALVAEDVRKIDRWTARYRFAIRKALGAFQINVSIQSAVSLLKPDHRNLALFRWILGTLEDGNRWIPVLPRYTGELANRIEANGGISSLIAPSQSEPLPSVSYASGFRSSSTACRWR